MTGDKMNELIKQRIAAVRRGEVPEGYQQINGYIIPRNWHLEPLSNKFKRSFRKNDSACDNVLTISAQLGLVSQKEYYDKDIASEDKSGYYLLKKGEFAYNKSYSTGYPFGAIKRLEKYETGIVSPLYICFTPLEETNASFYAQYFEAGLYNREIYRFAQEGARNHGLLNISTEDFFAGDLAVPPEEEQRKISEILSACDRGIALKQELVRELQRLKKTCLAKLFPRNGSKVPELRFPGFTAPWEERKFSDLVLIERGGSPRPIDDYITDAPDGLNWVKIGDAPEQGRYITKTAEKIKPEGLAKTRQVQPGDLILSNSMSFGKPYIMGINGCIHDGWLLIRDTQSRFDLKFLCHMLGTDQMLDQYRMFAAGSTVNNLNKELVGNTTVSLPSIEEQRAIGEYLESIDNLITLHQRELEEEQRKKKALMQLLLTGLVRIKV